MPDKNHPGKIRIAAVAAMARNRVIGIDNQIPWHIPADLKQFKARTMGKPVIMGRRTFESILASLGKPMPGRRNIVITRGDYSHPGADVYHTLDDALAAARAWAADNNADEIIIGGGGQVYELALPATDRIYLTVVQRDYDGDAHFPALPETEWTETARETHDGDPPFIVRILDRK
jgi:dihydrofolate reductase